MPARPVRAWRTLSIVVALAVVGAGCGDEGDETTSTSVAPGATVPFPTVLTVPRSLTAGEAQRASPRWEQVQVIAANEPSAIGPFTIAEGAIQWRVRWDCEVGTIRILTSPPPPRPGPLVESPCPGKGEGFSRQKGEIELEVQAAGPWKATVEQQVDTPTDEPPLREMSDAQVLGRGEFYNVEKTGKGTAILYRLPDGRRALRFEPGFDVLNDPDLVVWLSEATNPRTSKEVVDSNHVEIAALKSTKGSQNYIIPDDLPLEKIGSVALYCVPVPSIYIAASLE